MITFPLQAVPHASIAQAGDGRTAGLLLPAFAVEIKDLRQAVLPLFSVTDAGASDDPVTNSNHLSVVYFPFQSNPDAISQLSGKEPRNAGLWPSQKNDTKKLSKTL